MRVYSGEMVVTGGSFVKNSTLDGSEEETHSAGMTSAVHVKGGTLTASNAAFLLSGSAQYGIYSEDDKDESGTVRSGTVSLTNVSIQFVKDTSDVADEANRDTSVSHNYGVYAAADITLNGDCTVDVSGAWSGGLLAQGGDITYGNTHPGTLNVTMRMDTGKTSLSSSAIAAVDGKITFNGTGSQVIVKSDGIGVAVRQETSSQAETEKRGIELTAGSMNITTTRATALYVSGGSATFNSGTSVTVNSTIDGSCTVPVTDENGNVRTGNMYHGVFVQGGSLDASGATLNVTHRGIANDTKYSTFYDFVVKSYAVRVEGAEGGNNTVTITQGAITSVEEKQTDGSFLGGGGGLYVSGGTDTVVTLGQSGGADTLTIKAQGSQVTGGMTDDNGALKATWEYRKNLNGGHAVEVSDGKLDIWYGTYTAKMGNGILVSDGTANIHSGVFSGGDSYTNTENDGKPPAGPAASYAFKMYGGTANIFGGTFRGTGSGAFVMGTSEKTATANITKASIDAEGTAGFAVYRNATVTFGTANNTTDNNSIQIAGESAAITVEDTAGSSGSSVTIYSGTYWCNTPKDDGGSDGIFYGEETTSLTIHGGIFSGVGQDYSSVRGRSGLYLDADPGSNVKISAGTFYGGNPSDALVRGRLWRYYYDGGGIGTSATESLGTITDYIDVNISDILAFGSYISQTSDTGLVGRYLSEYTTVEVRKSG